MVSTLLHRMQADCPFARMHAVAHTLRLSHTQFLTSIEPQLHQFSNTPCFQVSGTPYTPCPRELAYTLVQQNTHRTINTQHYFAAKQIRARPCSLQSQHARHATHPKHHVILVTLDAHVLCHPAKMRDSQDPGIQLLARHVHPEALMNTVCFAVLICIFIRRFDRLHQHL